MILVNQFAEASGVKWCEKMSLKIGQQFDSYDDFEKERKQYENTKFFAFVVDVDDSKTLKPSRKVNVSDEDITKWMKQNSSEKKQKSSQK